MERVTIRIDPGDPSPHELKGYFAEVFASLDASPRTLFATIHTANDRDAAASIAIEAGEPVFRIDGQPPAPADFRGRWLAQHPSPLILKPSGARLILAATTGNRVIVRLPTLLERIFACFL